MISWHKKGQKVALLDEVPDTAWRVITTGELANGPQKDTVYEVSSVELWGNEVFFSLKELDPLEYYPASAFRPVYPEAVASLMRPCGARPSFADA